MTLDEVAQLCNLTKSQVRTIEARALAKIRVGLEQLYIDADDPELLLVLRALCQASAATGETQEGPDPDLGQSADQDLGSDVDTPVRPRRRSTKKR